MQDLMLADVRDYIASLHVSDNVYMSKLPGALDHAVGVYNSKHTHEYKTALGGKDFESYGIKYVTLLLHWSRSPRETEKAAIDLLACLAEAREQLVNDALIKFIMPLYEPQDIGTDDAGIYEQVIEAAFVYGKGG